MEYFKGIESFGGLASVYAIDILPDGSFSEIRIMEVNQKNAGVLANIPDTPAFYPGIPWRTYYSEINHEKLCYKCIRENTPMYSYVNAHECWIKGFYLPITPPDEIIQKDKSEGRNTAYLLYVMERSNEVDSESMSKRSTAVSEAVINLSIKLHESQNFIQSLTDTIGELRKICSSDICALYSVDRINQKCVFINENGISSEIMNDIAGSMGRTPFEVALAWESDLEGSDCFMLNDLSVIKERDPKWYDSLVTHGITSIILYAIRFNHNIVGFIWAANFDLSKMMQIKETLSLAAFLIGAVIANQQLISGLEEKSTVDVLTQVNNRNALNERLEKYAYEEEKLPDSIGVVFTDLNGLKSTNDEMGHDAGDKLLQRASAILKIAFGDYEIYRAGGDEFVIICPYITEEKLKHQIEQLRALAENTADIRFAIGSSFFTGKYDIRNAMRSADESMYNDKAEFYRLHPEKDRRKRPR